MMRRSLRTESRLRGLRRDAEKQPEALGEPRAKSDRTLRPGRWALDEMSCVMQAANEEDVSAHMAEHSDLASCVKSADPCGRGEPSSRCSAQRIAIHLERRPPRLPLLLCERHHDWRAGARSQRLATTHASDVDRFAATAQRSRLHRFERVLAARELLPAWVLDGRQQTLSGGRCGRRC
jgi:hypothetical protein